MTAMWMTLDGGAGVPERPLSEQLRQSLRGRRREQPVSHQVTISVGGIEVDVKRRIGREDLQALTDPVQRLLMT